MGCYVIPTTAAIVQHILKKKNPTLRTKHQIWLNHLLIGGSIFGVVDHLVNRELLAFSIYDLALGVIITLVTILIWQIMVLFDSSKAGMTVKS